MSIHGKYFVNHYEAKVFAGVLALVNSVFYAGSSIFIFRSMQINMWICTRKIQLPI